MTTTIRRLTAAVVLPAALMFTFTACGDDEGGNDSDNNSSTESNDDTETESEEPTETEETETEETDGEESEEGGNPPSAGGIPNPVEDPDAFEDYIEQMYVQAGMSPEQADCMAGAFMDNVDVDNLDDPSAITEMMSDPGLQEAMTACMS